MSEFSRKYHALTFLRIVLPALFALAVMCGALHAKTDPSAVEIETLDEEFIIKNRHIYRNFVVTEDRFFTWALANKMGNDILPPPREEFAVTLEDGTRVAAEEFQYVGRVLEELDRDGRRLIISLHSPKHNLDVQLKYWAYPEDFVLYKSVRIKTSDGRELPMDAMIVEHFLGLENAQGGGLGQPVFVNKSTFLGLEHPAGYALNQDGEVTLVHYPGWVLDGAWRESMTAVIGAAEKGYVRDQFFEYLQRVARPARSVLVYNSWYDIRREGMSEDAFLGVLDAFNGKLSPYGVGLDAVVLDDGWQDPDTFWHADRNHFPAGVAPLGKALEQRGSGMGLWLTLCSHGLNLPYEKDTPYEVSPEGHYFCMAGPKYQDAMVQRLNKLVTDARVKYFKHDFNYFNCTGSGPGYKDTPRHSFEDNAAAEMRILDSVHQTDPDVFSTITSHMWLSPWWLAHADTVWINTSDFGENLTAPAFEPRERSITYYDEFLYQHFHENHIQFPLNAIMTHGIIDGRRRRLGGETEPLLTWADNAMFYLGRGVRMRELYLSPNLLSDEHWDLLGQSLRWAESRDPVFLAGPGEMGGGDPARGQAYWFHNWSDTAEIFALRNSGFLMEKMRLKMRHPENLQRIVYPYHMWQDRIGIDRHGFFQQALGDHEVMVLETRAEDTLKRPAVLGLRSQIVRQDETETEYEIVGVPGTLRFFLSSPVDVHEVLFNGEALRRPDDGGYLPVFEGKDHFFQNPPFIVDARAVPTDDYLHIEIGSIISENVRDPMAVVLLSGDDAYVPAELLVNGAPADATFQGVGWAGFEFPLEHGSHTNRVRITPESFAHTPFAAATVTVTVMAGSWFPGVSARLVVRHEPAEKEDESTLPPPVRQHEFRLTRRALRPRQFDLSYLVPKRTLSVEDMKNIRAAKLRLRVFGSRSGGTPSPIQLNGAPVASIPYNRFPHDIWEQFTLDIPGAQLHTLKLKNKLTVLNMSGSAFKFVDAALAVQLEDGTWVHTEPFPKMLSTGENWEHAEGKHFDSRSPAIPLVFE